MNLARALSAVALLVPGVVSAHAVPTQMTPPANAALTHAPDTVSVHFDAELEPLFCKLLVTNRQGQKVSRGNGVVDANDHRLITARLKAGGKGSYRVYWSVVSRDGHRASGDYAFDVR